MSSLVLLALVFCAAAAPDVLDVGKSECDKRSRRKSTLKLIKETPFSGLFRDLKNSTVFEASGESKPLLQGCGQGFRRLRSGRGHGSVPVLWQLPPPPPAAAATRRRRPGYQCWPQCCQQRNAQIQQSQHSTLTCRPCSRARKVLRRV